MERIIHNLAQGSAEWHQHRQAHLNASEAPAMIGISKYQSRADLLKQKASGVIQDVDAATEALFANGHKFEAQAREWAAEIIGAPLLPIVASAIVDGLSLSASYDGATADGDLIFEHKTLSASLATSLDAGEIPDQYKPQMVQQMLILGSRKCLFMASNGNKETMRYAWYASDASKQNRLIAAWKQFQVDLAAYQYVEVLPPVTAAPVMALPALSIQVNGAITLVDNLKLFGEKLTAFIDGLDKNPSDDQAFADAEQAIKTLETAQNALEAAESSALAQVASVDEMRRTVALYAGQARSTRLMLTKLVASRKEQIRVDIVQGGRKALSEHVAGLDKRLGRTLMPTIGEDFAAVIKGMKTVSSLQNAVATELARCKIAANEVADRIQLNLIVLHGADAYHFLFADVASIVLKAPDDLSALVKVRISEHVAAEQTRLDAERERIRDEEQAKAVREQEERNRQAEQEAAAQRAEEAKTNQAELDRAAAVQTRADAKKRAAEAERQRGLDTDQLIVTLYDRIKGDAKYSKIAKAINLYMGKQKKAA